MNKKLLLVGFGQMGQALARGLRRGVGASDVMVLDPEPKAQQAAQAAGYKVLTSWPHNEAIDVVVLAVKPQALATALGGARGLAEGAVWLSIAAGVTLANLEHLLGEVAVVRAMPNTPGAIGEGMTVAVANPKVTEAQREVVQLVLQALGEVAWVTDEGLMDVVTAVSGSGPAYFFALMEGLEAAAVAAGLPADLAKTLVYKTAQGAGALAWAQRDEKSAAAQRVAVTSPGGTTAAGLEVLNQKQFMDILQQVVQAAAKRSRELALK